jgi:hypothetical protein
MAVFRRSPTPFSFGWIISILSSIAHPSLETVTITFLLQHVRQKIDLLELSTLDSLFMTRPLSKRSTELRFCICKSLYKEEVRTALKNGLPKLDGKKRLVTQCV